VKVQKEEADAQAASKDLQTVTTRVALNYSIDPDHIVPLYQNIGIDYKSRIVDPSIQEAVKATTAKFTAEELVTKREEVRDSIKNLLADKLSGTGFKVEQLSIINFDFSPSFNNAIEAKVTAEQNALAAKNKLDQVKYEAQQAIEEARGKATALQIEAEAINTNPQIIQLRAIEKWDGKLPQVTGNATPFINLK
jgi:regulator of protease activity HflC (stomatin/prohibitin superfamily)